jgi:hypothetical protein
MLNVANLSVYGFGTMSILKTLSVLSTKIILNIIAYFGSCSFIFLTMLIFGHYLLVFLMFNGMVLLITIYRNKMKEVARLHIGH